MRLRFDQLGGHLQRQLAPVYLICGEEPWQLGEAVRMVRVVEAEAALHARAVVVGGAVDALDPHDRVVLHVVGEPAAHAAERADGIDGLVGFHRVRALGRRERPRGAGLHAFAAGDTTGRAHRVVDVEDALDSPIDQKQILVARIFDDAPDGRGSHDMIRHAEDEGFPASRATGLQHRQPVAAFELGIMDNVGPEPKRTVLLQVTGYIFRLETNHHDEFPDAGLGDAHVVEPVGERLLEQDRHGGAGGVRVEHDNVGVRLPALDQGLAEIARLAAALDLEAAGAALEDAIGEIEYLTGVPIGAP